MVDIEKLNALAEAANAVIGDVRIHADMESQMGSKEEAEAVMGFMVAANPAAVLELIAENERFKAERDRLRAEAELLRMQLAACGVVAMSNTPESAGWSRDMHPDYMSASCQDVMRAVDREMAHRAEVEALRQDAERYRWLRDGASEQSEQSDPWDSVGHIQPPLVCLKPGLQVAQTGHDLDSAIDAAMAAKEGE